MSNLLRVLEHYNVECRDVAENVLCCLHNEREPSMSINPSTGLWYCFVCRVGGSPADLVMRKEDVPYWDAVRLMETWGINADAVPKHGTTFMGVTSRAKRPKRKGTSTWKPSWK